MKVFKRIMLSCIAIILAMVILAVVIFIYEDQFKKIERYRESSPEEDHVFVLYQVGSPEWPFGPVKAQIEVYYSQGKRVDKESIVIHTDGAQLSEFYIDDVRWSDTTLEVVCSGEDGTAVYVLQLAAQ